MRLGLIDPEDMGGRRGMHFAGCASREVLSARRTHRDLVVG